MALRVAIQMDPVGTINPRTDSTLLLGIEACSRGHEVFYYTPEKLSLHGDKVTARGHAITFFAGQARYYELGDALTLDLAETDVVLLRQDPPFNMAYITTTHLLEQISGRTLVVNDPASVRNYPEKLFPFELRQFMPDTLVTADVQTAQAFQRAHKDIIVKPLYGHGGRSILHLKDGDDNLPALMEMHLATSYEPLMFQPFLPEVKTGDRRIILLNGLVAGVMGRIPAEHEIRANFRVGGSPAKAELTPRQQEICEALGPLLRDRGILFAGLDVIGDYLTEINITSPTGFVQMNALYDKKLEAELWDIIESQA